MHLMFSWVTWQVVKELFRFWIFWASNFVIGFHFHCRWFFWPFWQAQKFQSAEPSELRSKFVFLRTLVVHWYPVSEMSNTRKPTSYSYFRWSDRSHVCILLITIEWLLTTLFASLATISAAWNSNRRIDRSCFSSATFSQFFSSHWKWK